MIKKKLYNLYSYLRQIPQHIYLKRIRGNDPCYVIDIDNTLTISVIGAKIDHINPRPRKSIIDFVIKLQNKNIKVIFLSARDFKFCKSTVIWLKEQNILQSSNDVFLVPSAGHKLEYLDILIELGNKLVYIDDLSFNHENGLVLFYTDVIEKVKLKELEYKGVSFINRL